MKRIIIIIFCSLGFSLVHAQQFKVIDNSVQIDTISESVYNKTQLFSNALGFISSSFKNTKAVISIQDLELGEIVFTGNLLGSFDKYYAAEFDKKGKKTSDEYLQQMPLKVTITCHLYLKDNKFKIVIKNICAVNSVLLSYGGGESLLVSNNFHLSEDKETSSKASLVKRFIIDLATQLNRKPENDF